MNAPLFIPANPDSEVRQQETAAADYLKLFVEAGLIGSIDVQVVTHLCRLPSEFNPAVLLGLAFAVRAPRFGHICVDIRELRPDILDTAEGHQGELPWPSDGEKWVDAIAASPLVRDASNDSRVTPFVLSDSLLYMDRYFQYQTRLSQSISKRARAAMLEPIDAALLAHGLDYLFRPPEREDGTRAPEDPSELNRQRLAAAMALSRPLSVICGGPGMGKTWTVRNILTMLFIQWEAKRQHEPTLPPLQVALAAPTGKASARMRESIRRNLDSYVHGLEAVTGDVTTPEAIRDFLESLQTSTLHRLLGYQPHNPSRFRHGQHNPLAYQIVIVDETSMVDFAMMAKLIDAVSPDARLILIGDPNQLASVEAGTVLSDLAGPVNAESQTLSASCIRQLEEVCKLPVRAHVHEVDSIPLYDSIAVLNKTHRFSDSSGIGHFARACLDSGQGFDPHTAANILTAGHYRDVRLISHGERGQPRLETQSTIVAGYSPYLELLFSGPEPGEVEADFHRRVLKVFDQFRILCAHRRGDLGVEGINVLTEQLLEARGPDGFSTTTPHYLGRPILVRANDYAIGRYNGDIGLVVLRREGVPRPQRQVCFPSADGGVEYLTTAHLPQHQTVFAMTIHSSQGSEFQHAMVVLPGQPSPILTRELIYTGVTRAAREMTLVGNRALLEPALGTPVRRASGLRAEIWPSEPL